SRVSDSIFNLTLTIYNEKLLSILEFVQKNGRTIQHTVHQKLYFGYINSNLILMFLMEYYFQ
ncbi:hypothetical protein, partial [Listeria innocua]|uniref:hypothetical protein n=1 Tax=Listeria innocua TaxID=1642 RepID=UPI001C8C4783